MGYIPSQVIWWLLFSNCIMVCLPFKKETDKTKARNRSCRKEGKKQSIGIKSFYSNTSYGFEYKKTTEVNQGVNQEGKNRKLLVKENTYAKSIYNKEVNNAIKIAFFYFLYEIYFFSFPLQI